MASQLPAYCAICVRPFSYFIPHLPLPSRGHTVFRAGNCAADLFCDSYQPHNPGDRHRSFGAHHGFPGRAK